MNWINALKTVAPTIAAALGGPVAGIAVKVASDALGGNLTREGLQDAVLSGDPATFMKLKQAENDLVIKLRELEIDLEKLHAEDRHSARGMAKKNMTPQVILSAIYTVGYMVVLWQFVTGDVVIPAQSQAAFSIILGVLTAAQTQILNFWFGSSSGSKQKTLLLKE